MPRIGLLVTGDAEHLGMHRALVRLFPSADFAQVTPRKVNGFTSNCLAELPTLNQRDRYGQPAPSVLEGLLDEFIHAIDPGRKGTHDPWDMVILLDDLELANAHQPARVVDWVRRGVRARLSVKWADAHRRERAALALQARGSFHLIAPMLEAWFFGEPAALDRAGRLPERPSAFDATVRDVEDFEVHDPVYLNVDEMNDVPKWDWRRRRVALRPRHPKTYLEFLGDRALDGRSSYDEVTTGVSALESLDWAQVLAHRERARFLRSLLKDIDDLAPIDQRYAHLLDGAHAPETWVPPRERGRGAFVLRNVT